MNRRRFRLATLMLVIALTGAAIEVVAHRVRRDARERQALMDFRNKYRDYPPSRVITPAIASSLPVTP